jgi:phenylacetic acid degradation operon negative regulatory protein
VLPGGQPVWTATLVRTLALLGVAEKAARQALARAAGEGWIVATRHGRLAQWQLTGAGQRLLADGARRIYAFGQHAAAWDGRWLVLLVGVGPEQRELRHRLRTRLSWAGFGALASGVWISPDPGREAEASQILADLGLATGATSFVASHGRIGVQSDIVARAWDLKTLAERYAAFIETFEPLDARARDDVLTAQILLVDEWRRFPFIDPELPRELLPSGWAGTAAAELFRGRHSTWQALAQKRWAELMSPT